MISVGDKVKHPKMPEWGIGKVLEFGTLKIECPRNFEIPIQFDHLATFFDEITPLFRVTGLICFL